jgi:hypothetical protein
MPLNGSPTSAMGMAMLYSLTASPKSIYRTSRLEFLKELKTNLHVSS